MSIHYEIIKGAVVTLLLSLVIIPDKNIQNLTTFACISTIVATAIAEKLENRLQKVDFGLHLPICVDFAEQFFPTVLMEHELSETDETGSFPNNQLHKLFKAKLFLIKEFYNF